MFDEFPVSHFLVLSLESGVLSGGVQGSVALPSAQYAPLAIIKAFIVLFSIGLLAIFVVDLIRLALGFRLANPPERPVETN